VMHPLCRSLKCCAFLQTIAPPALRHLFSQQTTCGNNILRLRRAAIQRRSSRKAQGAAKKGCGKAATELIFIWVLFVRTEIPCLRPKRYAQLRSQSQFCLTKCAPPIPLCVFVQSSPQRLIKAIYPPHPQGTKVLEKGDLSCAAVSTSCCLVLSSCSPQ
jgi:hypothetical protein